MPEIPPQSGVGFVLTSGQSLRVTDVKGLQVSDCFFLSFDDPREALSSGRSLDYNDTLRLTKGHSLYSNRSAVMAEITEDTCGRHDFLMPPCSLKMFQLVSGGEAYHPSCHENLARAFAPFGLGADTISTAFNIFMNVEVAGDGRLSISPPCSKAGDYVVLLARMDLIVGLTACSHEETNAGVLKPVRYEILPASRGPRRASNRRFKEQPPVREESDRGPVWRGRPPAGQPEGRPFKTKLAA